MFPHFSALELTILAVIALIFFGGATKLPDFARSFGKAYKAFKNEVTSVTEELSMDSKPTKTKSKSKAKPKSKTTSTKRTTKKK